MNWEERILNSDAGRGKREVAERMVREAGETPPDFVAQSAEITTWKEAREWFHARMFEMQEQGATWYQQSVDDPDNPKIRLVEGWKVKPKKQPSPHFQMTYKTPEIEVAHSPPLDDVKPEVLKGEYS